MYCRAQVVRTRLKAEYVNYYDLEYRWSILKTVFTFGVLQRKMNKSETCKNQLSTSKLFTPRESGLLKDDNGNNLALSKVKYHLVIVH